MNPRRVVVVLAAALGAAAPACVFWDMSNWSDRFGADGGGGATSSTSGGPPTACPSPDASLIAFDCFDRTALGSWGSADRGGSWSVYDPSALLSVGSGVGLITVVAGAGDVTTTLFADAGRDLDVEVTLADPALAPANVYVEIRARATGPPQAKAPTSYYAARAVFSAEAGVRGEIGYVSPADLDAGERTIPGPVLFPMVPGQKMRLRLIVSGAWPTSVQMKLWPASELEPADASVILPADDAGPQVAGGLGIFVYLSSNSAPSATVQFSDFVAFPVP